MSPTISFAADAYTTTSKSKPNTIYTRPAKKPKMSITQTYFLAHSARGKLSKEASRPDHDLRLLVGHANMLDSLMLDIANAEQEQERWFNHSLPTTTVEVEDEDMTDDVPDDVPMEEPEIDWEAEDAETTDSEDDEEESEELSLVRTKSRHSPPELTADLESDSDDEQMPSSPPDEPMEILTGNNQPTISTTAIKEVSLSQTEAESFEEDGFFIPSRSRPTIIAAY